MMMMSMQQNKTSRKNKTIILSLNPFNLPLHSELTILKSKMKKGKSQKKKRLLSAQTITTMMIF